MQWPSLDLVRVRSVLGLLIVALWSAGFAEDFTGQGGLHSSEKDTYERLGLSSTEWQKIKEARMPLSRVHELLESGISMTEYFNRPWMGLGISENDWVDGRRRGLTDEDMRPLPRENESAHYAIVQGLLLPGYPQVKRKQYGKGIPMAALAAGSLLFGGTLAALTAMDKNPPVHFAFFLLGVLPASMAWSAIDIHLQVQKELNPDASRFSSGEYRNRFIGIQINCPLRLGKS